MKHLIELKSAFLKYTGVSIANPHQAYVPEGITVVAGCNGSGKSSLATIIAQGANFMTNEIVYENAASRVKVVTFTDIYSLVGLSVEYYQQRFESTMNDDVPSLSILLGQKFHTASWQSITKALNIEDIADKKPNYLSSGELRKLLIANALADSPQILILDNPYIGLDAKSHEIVDDAIRRLSLQGLTVILLVADAEDIPDSTDAIIVMQDMTIGAVMETDGIPIGEIRRRVAKMLSKDDNPPLPEYLIRDVELVPNVPIVEMSKCRVAYCERMILNDIDWTINPGDAWALMGPNGSGKSTLLSLINADNPQAYCNDVRLFGRQRGSGESIWEIKQRIGYMSSELHLYFSAGSNTVETVICAGFTTAIGRYMPVTERQLTIARQWLHYFGIEYLATKKFKHLSFGQQRLVLLIRAFVRVPQLLILDEPMHGLDASTKRKALHAIEALSAHGVTLIYVTHCLSDLPGCINKFKNL